MTAERKAYTDVISRKAFPSIPQQTPSELYFTGDRKKQVGFFSRFFEYGIFDGTYAIAIRYICLLDFKPDLSCNVYTAAILKSSLENKNSTEIIDRHVKNKKYRLWSIFIIDVYSKVEYLFQRSFV